MIMLRISTRRVLNLMVSRPRLMSDVANNPVNPTLSPTKHKPSEFEKKILVWTKTFKNKEEIPEFLAHDVVANARSKARIKIANYGMLLTALGSLFAVISGKRAAKKGEGVQQKNLEWHRIHNEEHAKKQADKN